MPRKSTRWSTPADLRAELEKLWSRGDILRGLLSEAPSFPLRLRLRKPSSAEFTAEFNAVRDWIAELRAGDRRARGFGYEIRWREVKHRVHGANKLPAAVEVPGLDDALKLLGKSAAAARFRALTGTIMERFPELIDWVGDNALQVLEYDEEWPRLLAVLEWFRAHPRPGIYLRQLDIEGVDTKFIERRRKLIISMLDQVLPASSIDTGATGARGFERRYGLKSKPPLIRFRALDPALSIAGLTDLSVPPEEFAALELKPRRVFITENEINGLAFPDHSGGIVIFGLGYGLDRLRHISWLHRCELRYWGDIDTHGFAMLNRLRHAFEHARSMLMDRATLEAHRALWVKEPAARRFTGTLERLNNGERALFEDLRDNRLGERVRLEQERIGYGWLRAALNEGE